MENVEWKRIPGFPGYEVKAGECPQVRNRKSGRTLKAAPQLSLYRRGRVLITSPARCLYAAERGISPEDLPEGMTVVMEGGRFVVGCTRKDRPGQHAVRRGFGEAARGLKDGRDFMDLQLKAMETGDYRELVDFLMFFKEDTMERVRECSRADEKEKAWMAGRFPDAVAQAVKMAAEGKAFVGRPEQVLRSRLEAMAKRQAREAAKI